MGRKSPFRPGGLHETMIMRVAPFSLRGFIYYQGEEDWSRSLYYAKLNEMVIKQWREDFQDENLPFILTQLPMYIAKGDIDDKNWCILREQQELVTRNINHVSMAVTIDCGEFDNIHPIDKKTPGDRLALQSLGKVYGVLKKYDNMYIREVKYTGEIVMMEFENVYDGIKQVREIEGFEVAGSDLLFVKATAQISGKLIFAHNEQVKAPKYVRYAWTNFGKVNVYNSEGLPLAPFRK
jgi:sialate O-acetylesterase